MTEILNLRKYNVKEFKELPSVLRVIIEGKLKRYIISNIIYTDDMGRCLIEYIGEVDEKIH